MIVLKIIGFVILGILALIILLLCVKVRIFAEYSDVDTNVRLQWLFIKIPLYPAKKKDGGTSKNTADDKTESSQEDTPLTVDKSTVADESISESTEEQVSEDDSVTQQSSTENGTVAKKQKSDMSLLKLIYSAHGIDGLLLIVRRLFNVLGSFFGDLARSLVIDELYIDVMCNRNDAASTAIYYGEVCSSLFSMLGALVTKYKVRKYDINVYPDYLAKHSSASFAVSLHLYPIYLIGISIVLVMRLLFKVLWRLIVKCIPLLKNKQTSSGTTTAEEDKNNIK